MGRPARFFYDAIAQACDVLDGRGILSADNVLTHLGGGSKTTILRHYNAWLAARRAAATRPLSDVASEAFREALVRDSTWPPPAPARRKRRSWLKCKSSCRRR